MQVGSIAFASPWLDALRHPPADAAAYHRPTKVDTAPDNVVPFPKPGPSAYLRGAHDPDYIGANDNTPLALRLAVLPKDGYAYLGTAYTLYPDGRDAANRIACLAAAALMKRGIVVHCPIAHGHAVAEYGNLAATDWAFWKRQNQPIMDAASSLIVVTMAGWEDSVGLQHEIADFLTSGRPVVYAEPRVLIGVEG